MTTNTLSLRMDHIVTDTSILTQVVLVVILVMLILLVTFVNMIVWMVTRLITTRNYMFKYCQAGIVFANLISTAFCLPAQLLHISFGYWPFGISLCVFTITVNAVTFVIVMWLITILVMDRVLNSAFKDTYLSFRKKYTNVVHLIIWVILLVLTVPLFLVKFLKDVYKTENRVLRFQCHVPFNATTTLFHVIFGFASPLTIAGMMLSFLWLKIIKNKLIAKKEISVKYVVNNEKRAMTPWGNNWLHDIEKRVMNGPNNILPPLRRHSIGECEQETNEDWQQTGGKDRRNSLPEAPSEPDVVSEDKTCNNIPNSWCKVTLPKTGQMRIQTPSLHQKDTGKYLNSIQGELHVFSRANQNKLQHKNSEIKTSFVNFSQNRVTSDAAPSGEHGRSTSTSTAPTQTFVVACLKEDPDLPGTVQTDEPPQQTVEPNSQRRASTPRKVVDKQHSSMIMFSDSVPQDIHMKDNLWVRGSQVQSKLGISYDDDADANDDDDSSGVDDEIRVFKFLAILVGLNIVLWLPFLCLYYKQTLCDSCQTSLAVWTVLKCLGQISLTTNPLCLLLAHKDWKPLLKFVLSGFGRFSFQCFHKW